MVSVMEGQGAQPPDLALGAAHPPPGALDAALGAVQREQVLHRALLLGAREPLPVYVVAELYERIHVGHLLPVGGVLVVVFKCRLGAGRSPYVAGHRRGTGLGLAARACPRPGRGGRRDDGPVAGQAGPGFGGLLRQLRDDAGLTQDELAEAARVSQRAISDLERGINRTARKDTALLLAGALGLDGQARDLFVAAARGRGPVEAVLAARQGAVLRTFAAATGAERHNLPARLTSFVGREPELAALEKLLGGARLVTLTGAGGVGKTRLAVEFAAGATGRFRDGVWLADLVGITDPGLVPTVVMEALGARQDGDVPVIDALRWRLRSAQLLLVLDNCEHLLDACADLAGALLSGSAGLRVLATSRELLGVSGEVACPVQPLAVAAEEAGPTVIAGAPAVRLFLDRGSAVRAGAGLAGAPVAAVARICRELDGLPLAIELAAARTSVLSVEEIETHLSDKFAFLAYWRPVADPRHQALRTAIDWSYQLLTAAEQEAFRQLSVFAADFGLQQAAAVCCGGDLSG